MAKKKKGEQNDKKEPINDGMIERIDYQPWHGSASLRGNVVAAEMTERERAIYENSETGPDTAEVDSRSDRVLLKPENGSR
mmetsp:Transcript_8302/g.19867  ORF Transcript_8302/g.19867 Transcript_8302/m.19867 type:complete len:81 (+) Transcript_8302:874-1116(+)